MVALERKRKVEDGEAGARKKLKSSFTTASFILHSYSKLPDINEMPVAKSTPLDIFVWGTGSMCELGLGPSSKNKEVKRPRLNPYLTEEKLNGTKIVDFSVGGMHTLAVDGKSRIWSWGGNDSGVLGRDTSKAKEVLKDMDGGDSDDDDEDGDLNEAESTPGLVENLPHDSQIVQVAATDNLSAVLFANGDVYAWGCFRCNEGLLGFLRDEIKIQKTPLKIKELKNIVQLAAGKDHLLALDSKGIVYAWGNGQQFQLGRRILERHRYRALEPQQFGLYNIRYIASGDFHCFAIDHNDKVYAWGLNQYGQCALTDSKGRLEDGSIISKPTLIPELSYKGIKEIVAGEHHSLALTADGDVYAWGRYDMKEVGIPKDKLPESTFKDQHGNPRSVPTPTKLQFGGKEGIKIKAIGAGSHHSFAVTDDGFVYSWGFADTYGPGLGPLDEDVEKPTRIVNTATKNEDIHLIGAGGQFSVSGGVKIEDEDAAEDRIDKYDELDEQ
ncbi:pheromone response pathway [Spathaspora passalidarum NRRL Y-27907]|uniref:Pheromone response pathway n=1 Tax=Spathaspora passalidarum (strain NRRL Y-27907 / 11-Y1) TaxID=619300 RepID=G3AVU3_SPAPN|nr:pheromone response pathway [Spathaspora passalidarum NRRL Y-27907]EGW29988.1 pheromone response pathway [Spathaspora passalidarum NRRL Y-27907]